MTHGPEWPRKLPAGRRLSAVQVLAILIARTEFRAETLSRCGSGYDQAVMALEDVARQLRRARDYLVK